MELIIAVVNKIILFIGGVILWYFVFLIIYRFLEWVSDMFTDLKNIRNKNTNVCCHCSVKRNVEKYQKD